MMRFKTAQIVDILRVKREGPRKPLRSLGELADEFGIDVHVLGKLIKNKNGPEAVLDHRNAKIFKNKWYRHDEVRKWWRSIQEAK